MKKLLKLSALLIMTAFITAGCRSSAIYNVENSKIDNRKSSAVVYRAIKEAGQSLGWKITKIRPGVAEGKLYLRTHLAVVRINYSGSAYSIHYVRSENLDYDAEDQTIHSNYNGWVQNLEKAIDARL
ncbi:MAG TPA: hypothetical protein VIM88_00550 [Sulfurovum sp.]|uniref:hypothetical protein n=1 Tax=Sulfurovum sp. TaxID=1969726 RepID=UPI002F937FF2